MTQIDLITASAILLLLPFSYQIVIHVAECPNNQGSWKQRSAVFICEEKHKVYHCIKNEERKLVETCLQPIDIVPLIGGCPWVKVLDSKSYLGNPFQSCDPFDSGCPKKAHEIYQTNELYLYPTCITTEKNGSFLVTDNPVRTTTESEATADTTVYISIGIICSVAFCIPLLIICRRRMHSKARNRSITVPKSHCKEEMFALNLMGSETEPMTMLSSENLQVKLQEDFINLFNNEWREAIENLKREFKIPDSRAIHILLEILEVIYHGLDSLPQNQLKDMIKVVEPSARKQNMLIDIDNIQCTAPGTFQHIVKIVMKNCISGYLEDFATHCMNYITRSIEFCWNICVMDPPLILAFHAKAGDKFDNKIYTPYQEFGCIIDFMVWPVLYRYRNGPMVRKGVVQLRIESIKGDDEI